MKTKENEANELKEVKVANQESTNKVNTTKIKKVVKTKENEKAEKVETPTKVKKVKVTNSLKPKEVTKDPTKTKKVVKEVKNQQEVNLVESVVTKREVKYIYPKDCNDTLSRKKYRQQVRNKLHALELAMHRIENKQSKEFKAKQKEYLSFKKENIKEGASA